MALKKTESSRFQARTEDGRLITLVEYVNDYEAAAAEGASWMPGLKTLKTVDGQHVNVVGPGQYELIDGTRLTRV
jgi:hypothetical protein